VHEKIHCPENVERRQKGKPGKGGTGLSEMAGICCDPKQHSAKTQPVWERLPANRQDSKRLTTSWWFPGRFSLLPGRKLRQLNPAADGWKEVLA